jgi:hypothetical protein
VRKHGADIGNDGKQINSRPFALRFKKRHAANKVAKQARKRNRNK